MNSLELNGVANILAAAEMALEDKLIDPTAYEAIVKQCRNLQAYFKAANSALHSDSKIPYWHEVLATEAK